MFQLRSVLFSFIVAAAGCNGDPIADDADNLQGGSADSGDTAVGLVWIAAGGYCSGSLVAPNVVLTAGHCVESAVEGFYVGSGDPVTSFSGPPPAMKRYAVVDQAAHPSYESDPYGCPNPSYDVALLRLNSKVPRSKPLAMATAAPTKDMSCTAIGFGMHTDNNGVTTYEAKRRGTEHFDGITDTAVYATTGSARINHGDSGGPLLCKNLIVGAASCLMPDSDTEVAYGRVDGARAWIDKTIAGWTK